MVAEDAGDNIDGEFDDGAECPGVLAEMPVPSVAGAPDGGIETFNRGIVTRWVLDAQDWQMGDELFSVCRRFDEIVYQLDLETSPIFSNADVQNDFARRLVEFTHYLDQEITSLRSLLMGQEEASKFSDGWEANVRKAAYYAFFLHYGEKRRGEVSSKTGKLKDYVYHVVRSAFNCLGRKMRFFDEKTFLATILHDTKEEYNKGFLALLAVDGDIAEGELFTLETKAKMKTGGEKVKDKKQVVFDQLAKFYDEIERDLGPLSDSGELSVSDLVDLLTKTTGDRNRTLLEIFYRICCMTGDSKRQFSAMRAIMVKIADRLDNVRSLFADPGKPESVAARDEVKRKSTIEDETVYMFLALAKQFNMVNVADWFYDYLYLKDFGHRKHRGQVRRAAHLYDGREDVNMLREFEYEFNVRLNAQFYNVEYPDGASVHSIEEKVSEACTGGNVMLRAGVDYILSFREIGKRFEDPQRVDELFAKGKYGHGLLNFVIFYPIKNNNRIQSAGRSVFMQMFPSDIEFEGQSSSLSPADREFLSIEEHRPEIDTDLGRLMLQHGQGSDFRRNNYSDKYGVGVWSVFSSSRESVGEILGDFHETFFCDDSLAGQKRRKILDFWNGLFPEIARIRRMYNDYFPAAGSSNADEVSSAESRRVKGVLNPVLEEEEKSMAELMSVIMMTLFMHRMDDETNVVVNGTSHLVRLPENSRISTALIYAEPLLAGRRIMVPEGWEEPVHPDDVTWMEVDGDIVLDGPDLHVAIDTDSTFNPELFRAQAAQLCEEILPGYRQELIRGNMPAE